MTLYDIFRNSSDNVNTTYFIGTWSEVNIWLESMNNDEVLQMQKFPLLFLLTNETLTNSINSSNIITASANMYLFGIASENKLTEWRIDNELPELHELRDEFIEELQVNGITFDEISPYDDIFYDETLLNKLESRVNCIRFSPQNLEYDKTDC